MIVQGAIFGASQPLLDTSSTKSSLEFPDITEPGSFLTRILPPRDCDLVRVSVVGNHRTLFKMAAILVRTRRYVSRSRDDNQIQHFATSQLPQSITERLWVKKFHINVFRRCGLDLGFLPLAAGPLPRIQKRALLPRRPIPPPAATSPLFEKIF
jgi:hypothetical protein